MLVQKLLLRNLMHGLGIILHDVAPHIEAAHADRPFTLHVAHQPVTDYSDVLADPVAAIDPRAAFTYITKLHEKISTLGQGDEEIEVENILLRRLKHVATSLDDDCFTANAQGAPFPTAKFKAFYTGIDREAHLLNMRMKGTLSNISSKKPEGFNLQATIKFVFEFMLESHNVILHPTPRTKETSKESTKPIPSRPRDTTQITFNLR